MTTTGFIILFLSSLFTRSPQIEFTTYNLEVKEPSGLSFDAENNCLWTVSDHNGNVYKLDLRGEIMDSIDAGSYDLEGIALSSNGRLYLLDEHNKKVRIYNQNGKKLEKFSIEIESEPNSGPEGISFNRDGSEIYILNEKNPGLLQTYNIKGELINAYPLDFASDYSGLVYNTKKDRFLIVSDEDKSLYIWSRDKGLLGSLKLELDTPEGIAIDSTGAIYIVSDKESILMKIDIKN